MTLATDILKRAAQLPTAPVKQKREYTPRKKTIKPIKEAKPRPVTPPGVSVRERSNRFVFRAYLTRDNKMINLGEFRTPERAKAAHRLYMLWEKRGFEDIPNKPSFRTYRIADYS